MNKKIIVVLMVVLIVFSLGACTNSSTQEMTIKEGVLMVATEPEYPPMEYKDDEANLVGFDIEFAEALGEKLGLEIEFVEMAWDGIFLGLEADKYDVVISAVSITQDRIDSTDMLLSDAYMSNGQYIAVRNGYEDVQVPEDLAGKNVGVQQVTTSSEACKKYMETVDFTLTEYDTIQQAFLALKAGYVDAVVTDAAVALYYIAEDPDSYQMSDAKLTNEPFGVAMKYGNTELQEAINAAIAELHEDGTLSTLSEKYLDADATQNIDMELK